MNAIVLIDDIAATGSTLERLLSAFVREHRVILCKTKLRVAVLVATPEGRARVSKMVEEFQDVDIEFRAAEVLSTSDRAFTPDLTEWHSTPRGEDAKALCRDLGSRIYKRRPFGYGGLGLLVVFPTTVPNNTLPILHSTSKVFDQPWKPLFPRPTN